MSNKSNATPNGVEGDTMSDVKKLAADAAAAREKINQARDAMRESEAALVDAIADEVYAQHTRGVRWSDTMTHFGCTSAVYYSARKLGKERADAAAEAERKAAAEAEARAKAEAEARAAVEAEAARKASDGAGILAIQPDPNTTADDKRVMREAADAMAQIIESALVAHGIRPVSRINRSVNTALSKHRSTRPGRPVFMFELRTDWRLADGVAMPTAASAAPVDEIGKLQAGCDGLRAVLAMAQTQLNNMIAAKGIKP